jgi:hypothetical protein
MTAESLRKTLKGLNAGLFLLLCHLRIFFAEIQAFSSSFRLF